MSKTPALPSASAVHPLLYASLTPIESDRRLPCIDLYKPKAKYNLGRSPESDVVLNSQYFEWSYCTLLWDGKDEVFITDLYSVNGVWVNRRRITPGEPCILQDGDLVFFAMCGLEKPEEDKSSSYEPGDDYAYIYHQYTDQSSSLAPAHDGLEGLPKLPPPVHSSLVDELRAVWAEWDNIRKREPVGVDLPEDFRELFRPHTDDVHYHSRWRNKYQTFNRERPPPLPWGPPAGGWTKCYHHNEGPDWNNPDLVWDGLMPLDQSRPLTIPPSIIYWSARYKLPVYAHPRFEPGSSRIYARPYARSTDGFSDYSAAEERQKRKLPPLEDPPIVRPRQVLYSLDCQWCPDEDELAAKVAALLPTLRPDDELLPEPSPSPTYPPGSTPLTRWADFLDKYPRTLKKVTKRKRDLEAGDGGDAKCASLAPSVKHPPVIKDERSSDVSIPSTKRRRLNDSSTSFPDTNTQAQLHDMRVAEESSESAAAGDEDLHRPNGSSYQEASGF